MSEDFTRWHLKSQGYVTKIQKKVVREIISGSLDHFYDSKNLRNRSSVFELLPGAPKNTFELHLTSEIHQFEVEVVDFHGFSMKSLLLVQREM